LSQAKKTLTLKRELKKASSFLKNRPLLKNSDPLSFSLKIVFFIQDVGVFVKYNGMILRSVERFGGCGFGVIARFRRGFVKTPIDSFEKNEVFYGIFLKKLENGIYFQSNEEKRSVV